jgi:hypothetical protein
MMGAKVVQFGRRSFMLRTSPQISHYFCMIECFCDRVCWPSWKRDMPWRRETRELLELFGAAAVEVVCVGLG